MLFRSSQQSALYEKVVDEIHVLEMEKAKQEELVDSLESQKEDLEKELVDFDINFDAVLDKIDFVSQEIERISKEQVSINSQKTQASESKKQASDNYGKLRTQRDEIFEKLGDIKIKIEAERNDLKNLESELERIAISTAENEHRAKETLLEVQKNNSEIAKYQQSIDDVLAASAFTSSNKKVELVREKIASVSDDKKKFQEEMNKADGNKMLLAGEIQRAHDKKAKEENQLVKIDTELENLQNRVWEEYQLTYGDAKAFAVEGFDIKAGTEECINKIGRAHV